MSNLLEVVFSVLQGTAFRSSQVPLPLLHSSCNPPIIQTSGSSFRHLCLSLLSHSGTASPNGPALTLSTSSPRRLSISSLPRARGGAVNRETPAADAAHPARKRPRAVQETWLPVKEILATNQRTRTALEKRGCRTGRRCSGELCPPLRAAFETRATGTAKTPLQFGLVLFLEASTSGKGGTLSGDNGVSGPDGLQIGHLDEAGRGRREADIVVAAAPPRLDDSFAPRLE